MKTVFVIIILILLLAIIGFFLLQGQDIKFPDITNKDNLQELGQSSGEADEDTASFPTQDPEINIQARGAGSEAGSGGGSGSGSSSQNQCTQEIISYALKDFTENSECLSYSGEICTSKSVNCSVEVSNLDSEISGEFRLKLNIIDSESNLVFLEFTITDNVAADSAKIFVHSTELESQTEDGEANQDYECIFTTLETPKKEIC